jgi:ABC-type Fe3+ transport system substrate-binding protein
MSNRELQEANNRLNLEKQYRDLTRKKSKGKKVIDTFTSTATTLAAISAAVATYKKIGGPIVEKLKNNLDS